jgi:hypothetical protein
MLGIRVACEGNIGQYLRSLLAGEAISMLGPRVAVGVELISYLHFVLCGGSEVRCEVWSRMGWEVVKDVIHHWVLWGGYIVRFLFQTEVAQEVVFVDIGSRLLGWCVSPACLRWWEGRRVQVSSRVEKFFIKHYLPDQTDFQSLVHCSAGGPLVE